jgi:hypothetical protein
MNQKGLAPILIVILIALGIGGYILYQKQYQSLSQQVLQIDEMSSWKTYTNTKFGYSIKYPDKWEFIIDERSIWISPYPKDNDPSSYYGGISISVVDNPENLSITDFNKERQRGRGIKTGLLEESDYKQIKVNDLDGLIISGSQVPQPGGGDAEIFIKKGLNIYVLTHFIGKGKTVSDEEFNKILSTFKFTDQEAKGQIEKDITPQLDHQSATNFKIEALNISDNFALGVYYWGAPEGMDWIAMKEGDKWKKIWEGPYDPECSVVNKYSVPVEVYKHCY